MYPIKFAVLFTACLLIPPVGKASAAAEDSTACLIEIAQADLAAKSSYQTSLRNLIVRQRPEFTALADINRDLQILFAEMRFARLAHLLATAPSRLDSANGLSGFRNFNWTEADSTALLAADPSYRAETERLEALKAQNNGHPDWPALRTFVRDELSKEGAFAEQITAFQEHNAALEAALPKCSA